MTIQNLLRVFGATVIGVAFVSWLVLGFDVASILFMATVVGYLLVKLVPVEPRMFILVGLLVGILLAALLAQFRVSASGGNLYILILLTEYITL